MATLSVHDEAGISNERMHRLAPTVFAQAAHFSRSDRYEQVPTVDVVDALRETGLVPVDLKVAGTRDRSREGFQKHAIRFAPANTLGGVSSDYPARPEVTLINSHDGASSFRLFLGVFRLVCLNGMTVGRPDLAISVPHKGQDVPGRVAQAAAKVIDKSDVVYTTVDAWRSVELDDYQIAEFTAAAAQLRFGDAAAEIVDTSVFANIRRREDATRDLWTIFNRVQENLVRGGIRYRNRDNALRRVRAIESIDADRTFNADLWAAAEALYETVK